MCIRDSTGIAATLSMASSEYLSSKSEGRPDALKSASYTGVAYLVTVALLILPYLLFDESHYLWAMGTMAVSYTHLRRGCTSRSRARRPRP